jgi:hypothetical protein
MEYLRRQETLPSLIPKISAIEDIWTSDFKFVRAVDEFTFKMFITPFKKPGSRVWMGFKFTSDQVLRTSRQLPHKRKLSACNSSAMVCISAVIAMPAHMSRTWLNGKSPEWGLVCLEIEFRNKLYVISNMEVDWTHRNAVTVVSW